MNLRIVSSLAALFLAAALPTPSRAQDCPGGRVANDATYGHCCWPGQAWDAAASTCHGVPACPPGLAQHGYECVAPGQAVTPPEQASTYGQVPTYGQPASGQQPYVTPEHREIPDPPLVAFGMLFGGGIAYVPDLDASFGYVRIAPKLHLRLAGDHNGGGYYLGAAINVGYLSSVELLHTYAASFRILTEYFMFDAEVGAAVLSSFQTSSNFSGMHVGLVPAFRIHHFQFAFPVDIDVIVGRIALPLFSFGLAIGFVT